MKRNLAALKRLEDAHNLAAANGGTCLTTAPIGERRNFELSCPKGHDNFNKRHDSVMQGKYCPKCAMQAKGLQQVKHSKESLDAFAASKGGLLLSETYLGYGKDHRWQCDKGHMWESKPRMVLAMGSWCPACAGNKKYSVAELSDLVSSRGGKCLELTYDPKSERSTAVWECHFGHTWPARVDMIIRRGDWCPTCAGSYGERLCRQILEKLFESPFPKVRPKWLKGEKGTSLEIDMYNEGLFGVEYQGPHHYKQTNFTHDSHEQISARDALKAAHCKKREFVLVPMPQFRDLLDSEGCITAVKDELAGHGISIPDREISIDYRSVYVTTEGIKFFKELNAYVAERCGRLVSDQFTGLSRNYAVACKHGHLFTLNRYEMRYSKWCRECFKLDLYRKYSRMVEDRGGRMLAECYVSSSTPMEIESASGKRFWLTPHQLAHGAWIRV